MKPWFGLHLPHYTFSDAPDERLFDRVVEQARAAEQAGFSLVTVMDHLYQIPGVGPVSDPMLEAWSTLAALSRETTRVRLGTLVTGVTYRNPALLAKTATTLDVLSGGRAILGLGAAWNDVEHAGYGFDFPPIRERMDRLDEALTIVRAMFTEDRPSFEGRHYRISEALNVPRPVQPADRRSSLAVAASSGRLRIAAKHADMTHWFAARPRGASPQDGRPRAALRGDRARPGNDRADHRRAGHRRRRRRRGALLPRAHPPEDRRPSSTRARPSQMAAEMRPYLDAGFTGFTFNNSLYRTPEQIARVGELLALIT